ncbi:transcription factor IIIC subunit delta N-term-domain-containing protein [Zopfochytrium polystomum]|nr:transcription factor IIIC subunit delta N-term-domain-containing protein [Zopfochytrium polystomum]
MEGIVAAVTKLQSAPTHISALHWSPDNQIAALTAKAIVILSPKWCTKTRTSKVEMDRTLVTVDLLTKKKQKSTSYVVSAPLDDDWEVRSADAADEQFRCMCWSPVGCSRSFGPVIAAATTSHHVGIFEAAGNPAKSVWHMICDVSEQLLSICERDRAKPKSKWARTNRIETLSLAWSEMLFYGDTVNESACLLVTGSKDGTIFVWTFTRSSHSTEFLTSIQPSEAWVNLLSISPWFQEGELSSCFLASCYSSGESFVHKISMRATALDDITVFRNLSGIDRRPISTMRFCVPENEYPRLALSKGSTIVVWVPPSDLSAEPSKEELSTVNLPVKMPASSLVWSALGEELRIYTPEGSALTVAHVNGALEVIEDNSLRIAREVLEFSTELQDSNDAGEEDGEENDADRPLGRGGGLVGGKFLRFYGADRSCNDLFDAIIYTVE